MTGVSPSAIPCGNQIRTVIPDWSTQTPRNPNSGQHSSYCSNNFELHTEQSKFELWFLIDQIRVLEIPTWVSIYPTAQTKSSLHTEQSKFWAVIPDWSTQIPRNPNSGQHSSYCSNEFELHTEYGSSNVHLGNGAEATTVWIQNDWGRKVLDKDPDRAGRDPFPKTPKDISEYWWEGHNPTKSVVFMEKVWGSVWRLRLCR